MCPIWRGSIKHRCHQSEHHQAFPWLNKNYHDSSKIYVFHVTKSFHSPWNTKLESYQYTASVAIPNCIKALALLSFCLGMQNQEGVVIEWVSEWVGLGRLLLGVFWLSQLGRQIVSVRAQDEPLGDPHSHTWTQAAISTVIISTTSSLLSGDETNSTTFGDEHHPWLELMWWSNGTMHYETVHSGSEEWSCVLQYTFQWLIICKHQKFQA
jgi:hypothetical protein